MRRLHNILRTQSTVRTNGNDPYSISCLKSADGLFCNEHWDKFIKCAVLFEIYVGRMSDLICALSISYCTQRLLEQWENSFFQVLCVRAYQKQVHELLYSMNHEPHRGKK